MNGSRWQQLAALVLATMSSQALLVVLAPTMVAIASDLGSSVSTVGQARSVTAGVSIAASLLLTARAGSFPVPHMVQAGAVLAVVACAAVAVSTTTAFFLAAHVLVGLAFALLLSGGFAGIAAFDAENRAWATGYVAASNAMAWILVNPVVAALTEWVSWRAAEAVPALVALTALVESRHALPVPAARVAGSPWLPLTLPSARRWVVSEVVAFGSWTAMLTFIGAFFIESLGVRESTTGVLLAGGAASYVATSTRSGWWARLGSRRRLVMVAALVMAVLLPLMALASTVAAATLLFCLIGAAAGVRTPASAGLALAQLPERAPAMMAARTAATQLGYAFGALVGGAVIAGAGFQALWPVLSVGMVLAAWLVRRVDDDSERARQRHPHRRATDHF